MKSTSIRCAKCKNLVFGTPNTKNPPTLNVPNVKSFSISEQYNSNNRIVRTEMLIFFFLIILLFFLLSQPLFLSHSLFLTFTLLFSSLTFTSDLASDIATNLASHLATLYATNLTLRRHYQSRQSTLAKPPTFSSL